MRCFILAAAAAVAGVSAAIYPAPHACSGSCFTHDPSVARRDDGTYFLYSSSDLLSIRTSKSLEGPWAEVGSVIQNKSVIDMAGNDVLWAPDVSRIDDLYYCLYAVSVSGSQTSAIGYATSSTMEPGSWTDQGMILESSPSSPYNCIDPSLVRGNGTNEFYMLWGSYWKDIYLARTAVEPTFVYPSGNQRQIAYNTPSNGSYMEGAFMHHHGGYYYLFLSVGRCCNYDPLPANGTEYHVNVCRSTSPAGPFVDDAGLACIQGGGKTVLASHGDVYAPGGQGVFHDPKYGDVMYYHYCESYLFVPLRVLLTA